jgi:hypothetical protein
MSQKIPRWRFGLVLVTLFSTLGAADAPPSPAIHLERQTRFEVTGLDAASLTALTAAKLKPPQWSALFAVYVDAGAAKDQPPLLGNYTVADGVLRFEPRFALSPGVRYRAVFDPAQLPNGAGKGEVIRATFDLPRPATVPTVVEHIYPTRDRLPENLLKFYIHFSAPMSRGEAYRHIRLLDATGKPAEDAFLELGEELWEPQRQRFTLFIDPGRIKRGLRPREELGPVLEAGKKYTLEIDRDWNDGQGNPLKETYRKTFQATAPVEQQAEPKTWKIDQPIAGTKDSLHVRFPQPLDHALLQRLLRVTDDRDQALAGSSAVTEEETCWVFTPQRTWPEGACKLVVDTALEDLAGNSIGRPFEVDLFHPVQREAKSKTISLPLTILPSPRR